MKPKFSIIKRAYLRVGIGAVLIVIAMALFISNARLGEEFTGGVKIVVNTRLDEEAVKADIQKYLLQQGFVESSVSMEIQDTTSKLALKTTVDNDEKVNTLSQDIQKLLVSKGYISDASMIIEQSITGPSIGKYMQKSAKSAIIVGLILMAIYMLFSFSTIRKYVAPGVLAGVTIATMVFDVALPAGMYAIRMHFDSTVMIDSVFVIALLTNMGYSINDTIIIFDRIRENIQNKGGNKGVLFGKIFEESLRQTMRRSFGTVVSTFVVILAMFLLGSGVVQKFAFTIGMGVIFGSYSSIFISAPLAYILLGKYKKERKEMLALKTKEL